jgi:hypothetical protein
MKATLQQIIDHLGIERQLGPYDSLMYTADESEKGITCTAAAAMNAEGNEIDVTIDVSHTTPKPDTPDHQQYMYFHIKKDLNDKWTPDVLRLKNEAQNGKIYEWEKKACEFFLAVIVILQRGDVPDLDELSYRIFKSGDGFGAGTAGGGKRNPIIRPEQLMKPMGGTRL